MMLIATALVLVWALGLLTSHAMGGLVHLLLFAALVAVLIHIVRGRRIFG